MNITEYNKIKNKKLKDIYLSLSRETVGNWPVDRPATLGTLDICFKKVLLPARKGKIKFLFILSFSGKEFFIFMIFSSRTYTAESVTSGYPDKVCDQISDVILDECLKQDPESRAVVETFGSHEALMIGGEIISSVEVDFRAIAKKIYCEIGYRGDLEITTNIVRQSSDITQGVDPGGAGDQGIMYGCYATQETSEFMPREVVLVHKLAAGLEKLRRHNKLRD